MYSTPRKRINEGVSSQSTPLLIRSSGSSSSSDSSVIFIESQAPGEDEMKQIEAFVVATVKDEVKHEEPDSTPEDECDDLLPPELLNKLTPRERQDYTKKVILGSPVKPVKMNGNHADSPRRCTPKPSLKAQLPFRKQDRQSGVSLLREGLLSRMAINGSHALQPIEDTTVTTTTVVGSVPETSRGPSTIKASSTGIHFNIVKGEGVTESTLKEVMSKLHSCQVPVKASDTKIAAPSPLSPLEVKTEPSSTVAENLSLGPPRITVAKNIFAPPSNLLLPGAQDLWKKSSLASSSKSSHNEFLSATRERLVDQRVERIFNSYWSQSEPWCSVCVLFHPKGRINRLPSDWERYPDNPTIPPRGPVYCPPCLFPAEKNFPSSSQLLVCRQCKVCIHAVCYASYHSPLGRQWTCDRCACFDSVLYKSCNICGLGGGAMKRSVDAGWAHVQCIIFLTMYNRPIQNMNTTPVQALLTSKQPCYLCSRELGAIPCCDASCGTWFHITCAQIVGLRMDPSPYTAGHKFFATCLSTNHDVHDKSCGIQVGVSVWVKHHYTDRYYKGKIEDICKEIHHTLLFDDKSWMEVPNSQVPAIPDGCERRRGMTVSCVVKGHQTTATYIESREKLKYKVHFDAMPSLMVTLEDICFGNTTVVQHELKSRGLI